MVLMANGDILDCGHINKHLKALYTKDDGTVVLGCEVCHMMKTHGYFEANAS